MELWRTWSQEECRTRENDCRGGAWGTVGTGRVWCLRGGRGTREGLELGRGCNKGGCKARKDVGPRGRAREGVEPGRVMS